MQPKNSLTAKGHRPRIPYNPKCESALKRLGLFHIARIGHTNLDKAYITALVERWRPETHTFHMPVGEMTITLQDVACLWGLPISGIPVTGVSDRDWASLVQEAFGRPIDASIWIQKKRKVGDQAVYKSSRYSLSLSWLREHFSGLPDNATPEQVDRYTRAFVMDLFGSLLFPDSSWVGVPAMYLQFVTNLEHPRPYNWGAAVLAYLYRGLSIAARIKSKSIVGPLILLQMWAWTWFSVSRPRPCIPFDAWGEPDLDSCQPYGRYWTGEHNFEDSPHNVGPKPPRDQLDAIMDNQINWCPYNGVMSRMPSVVHRDSALWIARVPLIHFWIVCHHYPDRVMRQFGFFQMVSTVAYVQRGDLSTRQGVRAMKDAHWGIRHVLTRGLKRIGKAILMSCRGHLEDVGQSHRLDRMLREAGLPTEIDDIPIDDEAEGPPGLQPLERTDAEWHSLYNADISFSELLRRGDTAGPSTSQPFTQGYPHTQDSQQDPCSSSVPDNFEFDISFDDQHATPDLNATPDQSTFDASYYGDPADTRPLALRRPRREVHPPIPYTPGSGALL